MIPTLFVLTEDDDNHSHPSDEVEPARAAGLSFSLEDIPDPWIVRVVAPDAGMFLRPAPETRTNGSIVIARVNVVDRCCKADT